MAAEHTCYEGSAVPSFQFYLQRSGEHQAMLQTLHSLLPAQFLSISAGKNTVDVLGVGSGGGEMDVQILSLLQSTISDVSITAGVVEGSSKLVDHFKALVGKTPDMQTIPFDWHVMHSGEYEKEVVAKASMKKFDFIHMIQMIYYVDDLSETIKFYHGLLKNNGRLMIIVEAANSGWDVLWKTHCKELCVGAITQYRSSAEIITSLKSLALKYDEHDIPNSYDISDCFDPSSVDGERLMSFMTGTDHFSQSFTPEIRTKMLNLLKNTCSTQKEGKIFFNSALKCILVHA